MTIQRSNFSGSTLAFVYLPFVYLPFVCLPFVYLAAGVALGGCGGGAAPSPAGESAPAASSAGPATGTGDLAAPPSSGTIVVPDGSSSQPGGPTDATGDSANASAAVPTTDPQGSDGTANAGASPDPAAGSDMTATAGTQAGMMAAAADVQGGEDAVPATFATVKSVFTGAPCLGAGCHNDDQNPLNLREDEQLHARLLGGISENCGGLPIVNPGQPQASALVTILKGPCGPTPRMPLGCMQDGDGSCLPAEYIAAIERWIEQGAPPQ